MKQKFLSTEKTDCVVYLINKNMLHQWQTKTKVMVDTLSKRDLEEGCLLHPKKIVLMEQNAFYISHVRDKVILLSFHMLVT